MAHPKNRNKELHFATFHDAKSSTSSLAPRIAPNAKHRANDWKGNLKIDLKKLRDLVAFLVAPQEVEGENTSSTPA